MLLSSSYTWYLNENGKTLPRLPTVQCSVGLPDGDSEQEQVKYRSKAKPSSPLAETVRHPLHAKYTTNYGWPATVEG